jgi:hypothetical protein
LYMFSNLSHAVHHPGINTPLSSGFDSGVVSSCTARVRCHGVCFLQAKIYRLSKAAHTRGVIEGNGERGNERAHALRVLNRGSPKRLRDRPLQSPEVFGRFPVTYSASPCPPRNPPNPQRPFCIVRAQRQYRWSTTIDLFQGGTFDDRSKRRAAESCGRGERTSALLHYCPRRFNTAVRGRGFVGDLRHLAH